MGFRAIIIAIGAGAWHRIARGMLLGAVGMCLGTTGGCHGQILEDPVYPVVFELDYERSEPLHPSRAAEPVRIAVVRVAYSPRRDLGANRQPLPRDEFFVPEHTDPQLSQLLDQRREGMEGIAEFRLIGPEEMAGSARFSVPWREGLSFGAAEEMRRHAAQGDLPFNSRGLRCVAAAEGCNLLLVYNTPVKTRTNGTYIGFCLTLLTWGAFPGFAEDSDCECYAVLIDVGSGYVYRSFEARHHAWQIANAYTAGKAMMQSVERSRRRALGKVWKQFTTQWPSIRRQIESAGGAPVTRRGVPRGLSEPRSVSDRAALGAGGATSAP